jgi:hypothetical protein
MLACFEQIFGVTWRKALSCLPPFSELKVPPVGSAALYANPITNAILLPEEGFAPRHAGGGSGVLELRWA